MGDALVRLGNCLQAVPYLTTLGDEAIVGIDDEERGISFSNSTFGIYLPFLRIRDGSRTGVAQCMALDAFGEKGRLLPVVCL